MQFFLYFSRERLNNSCELLHKTDQEILQIEGKYLLVILATKQDLPNLMNLNEIAQKLMLFDRLVSGWNMGKNANNLFSYPWEEKLKSQLDQVRKELRITAINIINTSTEKIAEPML